MTWWAPGWVAGDRVQFDDECGSTELGTVVGFKAPKWMIVRFDGRGTDTHCSMPNPFIQPAKPSRQRNAPDLLTLTRDEVSLLLEGWVEKDKYGEADRVWDRMLHFMQIQMTTDEFFAQHMDDSEGDRPVGKPLPSTEVES